MRRRKMLLGMTGGALAAGTGVWGQDLPLEQGDIHDLATHFGDESLIVGFDGNSIHSRSAQALALQIRSGKVGGVVFVKDNIGDRDEVLGLTSLFSENVPRKPLLAIDHEGGAVQRLTDIHGAFPLPSAFEVAQTYSPEEARTLYRLAGHAVRAMGFNFNLAPVVDRHFVDNPAVGHFKRSFSHDPGTIVTYSQAFIDGFSEAGVMCAIKHFPGQGSAASDSHVLLPELDMWTDFDLSPFRSLAAVNPTLAVMGGFSRLPGDHPAALSRQAMTDILRNELKFEGVALTDDLDMGATGFGYQRQSVAVRALEAGNDMIMIRNRSNTDDDLPGSLAEWIRKALSSGQLTVESVNSSLRRIASLRARLA